MFLDWTYILVIIGAAISALAAANVRSTYSKFSTTGTMSGLRAEEVAEKILRSSGITDVRIERVPGNLTDHYSPKDKVLRLSNTVYGSPSVAAIGVAAHECGHAIQHQEHYAPLVLRNMAVPIANFGGKLAWPVVFLGLILGYANLAMVGVILFSFVVVFQLLTLPVEFNASRRALMVLEGRGILTDRENECASRVLFAAALTYVAALFTTILQLLRLILLTKGGGRRRR